MAAMVNNRRIELSENRRRLEEEEGAQEDEGAASLVKEQQEDAADDHITSTITSRIAFPPLRFWAACLSFLDHLPCSSLQGMVLTFLLLRMVLPNPYDDEQDVRDWPPVIAYH